MAAVMDGMVRGLMTAGLSEGAAMEVPVVPFAALLPGVCDAGSSSSPSSSSSSSSTSTVSSTSAAALCGPLGTDAAAWRTFGDFVLADGPLSLAAAWRTELLAAGAKPCCGLSGVGVAAPPTSAAASAAAAANGTAPVEEEPVWSTWTMRAPTAADPSGVAMLGAVDAVLAEKEGRGELTFMQSLWVRYWAWSGGDQQSLVWTYAVMNVFYVVFAAVFFGLDMSRVLWRQRLQPDRPDKWPTIRDYLLCLRNLVANYILVVLPLVFGVHPLFRYLGFSSAPEDIPSLWVAIAQFAFYLWAEDFTHYWLHRALHLPVIYPWIHKMHHLYSTPFGLAAAYAHPIEVLVLGFCTFAGPLVTSPHYIVFYPWIVYRQVDAIFTHCGYDFPGVGDWLPYYGGTPAHDLHHRSFNYNFSSRFTYLDIMFNTFLDPQRHHERVVAKARRLNAWPADDGADTNNNEKRDAKASSSSSPPGSPRGETKRAR